MDRTETREAVLELLQRFTRKLPGGMEIKDSMSLIADLNVDSADLVELVLEMEDRFQLEVPDSALHELKTVGDVIDFVSRAKQPA